MSIDKLYDASEYDCLEPGAFRERGMPGMGRLLKPIFIKPSNAQACIEKNTNLLSK